jgi:predicted Zn-dependent peptidase
MYKLKTLPSGLRILSVPSKHTAVFSLFVLVGTGSKYESSRLNGISHFLEHMFFKGTKHRPTPGEVARTLDGIGAQYNAFTSKEVTGYWVKASREHFPIVLNVVSDIVTNSLLSHEEIEKERGVIIQELRMRNDDPQSRAWILFEQLLWGDQPAGWPVIGVEKNIKSFSREDFVKYFQSQYSAKNTLVIVSGAFPKNAEANIKKTFSGIGRTRPFGKKRATHSQREPRVLIEEKPIEATNIILGFPAFSMYDKRRFALRLLSIILGGNMSSRLFTEVREKRGLAYYVSASPTLYTDSGYIEISAGVPHDKVATTIDVIGEELRRIKRDGISVDELKKAKDYVRGNTAIEMEDSSSLASFFGEQALFKKKIQEPNDLLCSMDRVTEKEIQTLARQLFVGTKANVAIVGYNQDTVAIKGLLKNI